MKVPFVDLKENYLSIKDEIWKGIEEILENTSFIKGKPLAEFEENWAKACNAKYCIGTSSGTTSLDLIFRAMDIKSGDEIICPSFTFIATAEAIANSGATPIFADSDVETGLISATSVRKKITPKTKAIVIVDLYGQPADYDAIKEVIGDRDIKIIQDAAQSHLGKYKQNIVGSYAYATSFSFYPGKNLGAYGDAGAVVTDDEELAFKIRMLSDHGRTTKYEHDMIGFNFRMDALQAKILDIKLKHLGEWIIRRREAAELYHKYLSKGVDCIEERENAIAVYHLFVIKSDDRDGLLQCLKQNDIAGGIHYPIPLHLQPCFKHLGYKEGDLPSAEKLANTVLSLPIYPEITEEIIEQVAEVVNDYLGLI